MKPVTKSSLKITAEIFIGLIFIILIAAGGLAWRLSQGPMILDQFIPRFEAYFNDRNTDKIDIQSMVLEWNDISTPPQISVSNVVLKNEDGPFLLVPEIEATFSIMALFTGSFEFETVWIRDIAVSITKTKDGKVQISGRGNRPENQEQKAMATTVTLNDFIYDMPEMKYFWLDGARIAFHDNMAETTKFFDPVTFFIESSRGEKGHRSLSGYVRFPFDDQSKDTDNVADAKKIIKLEFETFHDPLNLVLNGQLKAIPLQPFLELMPTLPDGLQVETSVNAEVEIILDNLWGVDDFSVDLDAIEGSITAPIENDTINLDFTDLSLKTRHDLEDHHVILDHLSFKLNNEVPMNLRADIRHFNDIKTLAGSVHLDVSDLPHAYLKRYWPKSQTDNGAYRWLIQKITDGFFPTVSGVLYFDMAQKKRDDGKPLPPWLRSARGEFTVENGTVNYKSPMAPATQVKGKGVFEDISLTLSDVSGIVGGMKTTDAHLYMDDLLTRGAGLGTLKFPIESDLQSVFDFLAAEPITAFDKVSFDPLETKGDVKALLAIKIPLIKGVKLDAVDLSVTGTIDNADIPNALNGLSVTGGPYDIQATANDLKLSGSGQIGGAPMTINEWHEYFSAKPGREYSSKMNGIVTSNDTVRRAFIDDIADHFKGDAVVEFEYLTNAIKKTTIDLNLDLTKTEVEYKDIGLYKSADKASKASLAVILQKGDLSALENIVINGHTTTLEKGDIKFQTKNGEPFITKATLDNLSYNDNEISVLAVQEGDVLKANVTGDYLNAFPFLSGDKDEIADTAEKAKGQSSRPFEIGINVTEMQIADIPQTLKMPKAYIRLNGQGGIDQLEMDANLGEGGQNGTFSIRYTPEVEDGLTLRVKSDNAGELFRTLDLYPYLNGGFLQVAGKPIDGGSFGDVEGMARIDNFSVANAPVLLRLVNALSFENFLTGGALRFTRLESDFKWQLNDSGDIYTVRNGTTSGASVALTFDGYVDTGKNDMKISGTAAPLSELNNFVSKIPVVGQLLTGGGALLAATYSISGNPDDPGVTVNPLSVLTPGIVRKMLFESTPEAGKETQIETEIDPKKKDGFN